MTDPAPPVENAPDAGRPDVAASLLLYAAFFATGAAALTFEVLWIHELVTVVGAGTYAISVVLCAFMAGLGAGGWAGGQIADRFRRRLLAYGAAEILLGLWALMLPAALSLARTWAPRLLPSGAVGMRLCMSFAVLFVPCFLMGTTLPLLTRCCADTGETARRKVSVLYGVNTLGAMVGCFATGFWFLGTFGIAFTNRLAVGVSLLVGACATIGAIARRRTRVPAATGTGTPSEAAAGDLAPAPPQALLLVVAFASGLGALACEVVWARYLTPLYNVAYTFPTILGVYLLGVGAGSLVCRAAMPRIGKLDRALAVCLIALGLAVVVPFVLGALLSVGRTAVALPFSRMVVLTVLPAALVMGLTFPLICAAYTRSIGAAGRSVGNVYALNTLGAIAGALLPAFVLIPTFGIQDSLLGLSLLYGLLGILLLRARRALAGAGIVVAAVVLFVAIPGDLARAVILSRNVGLREHRDLLYYREGRTSTEAIEEDPITGHRYLYMNGAIEVTTAQADFVSFKLMAAIGPLLHRAPDEVLMVCFGGGLASGSATQHPRVQTVRAVDIEPDVLRGAKALRDDNHDVVSSPKFRFTVDDGRNYVLTSGRRWPVIVSDSLHPKSSDSWVLYTQEFYRTMADHLTDDGIFVQWGPFRSLSVDEYRGIVRTFQSVFPHASLWFAQGVARNALYDGYSLLVGAPGPLSIDVEALARRLEPAAVRADLQPWGLDTVTGFLDTFVCGEERLRQWAGGGPVNTDDLPYVQYKTPYSAGPECVVPTFAPLLESCWPCLQNTGSAVQASRLQADLAARVEANRLMFTRRFEQAIALMPDDPKFQAYAENLAAGIDWIDRVSSLYADNADALIALGMRAASIPRNLPQAVELYRRAAMLRPEDPVPHHKLGVALATLGDMQQAVEQLSMAVRLAPDAAVIRSNLGMALFASGDTDAAAIELQQALRLNPSLSGAHRTLGMILLRQGRRAEAEMHLRKALELDPRDDETRRQLNALPNNRPSAR
jgi:spermidine synthase